MKGIMKKQTGFTIVELLIVIVVIGILATITIVVYSGVQDRAKTTKVMSDLSQVHDSVRLYAATHQGNYPATLAEAGANTSSGTAFQFTSENTSTNGSYALTASNAVGGSIQYFVSDTQETIKEGVAPGHNLIAWSEPDTDTAPVAITSGVSVDTSSYHSAPASVRLGTGATGRLLKNQPTTGSPGDTITVELWMRTDINWNGTGGNSKIRFGGHPGGALLHACSYNGVKTAWTKVTCSWKLTSANSSVGISVGNDGSAGNIWLDDISVSVK